MSSLDELILFNSAFWREEGMLDGTKYALYEEARRALSSCGGSELPGRVL